MKYIIVSILLILSAGSNCKADVQFEYYYNEQRPGGDYKRLRAHNVDECARACTNDRRCRAFDFDTYERQCWLKDRIPYSKHNRDVISGVKRSDRDTDKRPQREIAGLLIEDNTKLNGGDYKTITAKNVNECARACANDRTCQSFNYGKQHHDCWLKYKVPDGVYSNDIISGYKTSSQDSSDDNEWTTGDVAGLFLENNTQRKGGNYKKMTVRNARACVKLCAAESICQSFNYDETNQVCRLKNNIPQGIYNDNVISGYKLEPNRPGDTYDPSAYEVAGLLLENNTKRNGGDYNKFTVRNVKECARACANDRTCQSFNYGKKHRDCWLKNNIPRGIYNDTVISGYKKDSNQQAGKQAPSEYELAGLLIEDNTKRSGGDYAKIIARNVKECAMACANDGSCKSFNYDKEHRGCWLKHNIPDGIYNRTVISGYKVNSRRTSGTGKQNTFEVAGVRLENNVKRNGGDYTTFTVKNVKECAVACATDDKCRSFNYGKEHRDCWLKHNVPKGVHNKTVISGVKQR